jgi:lysophospholipase L1-like esterase
VVVLGDSIATGSEGGTGTSYGAVYADLLEQETGQPVELTNLADRSETSDSLLASLQSPGLQESIASADVVVITVGGNDGDPFATYEQGVCAAGGDPAACIGAYAPDQEANLDEILTAVEGLRGGQPTAIRLTSPDYNPFIGVDRIADVPRFPKGFGLTFFRQVAVAENDNACRVAQAHDAGCADFLHVFNGPQGDQPATAYLGTDHLHPSEAGQQAIAKALLATGLAPLS